MKRIIYGVGCFLIVLFFTVGFLITYQITDLKDRIYALEETNASAKQQASVPAVNYKNKTFVLEHYQNGILQKDSFKLHSYGTDKVVFRQEEAPAKQAGYQLQVEEGYISLYMKTLKIRFLNIPTFRWKLCHKNCKVKFYWESRWKPLTSFTTFWRIIPAKMR